jgi:hypothetical protein
MPNKQTNKEVSRRQLLAAASGQWVKPAVEVGLRPAPAQGSAPTPTATSVAPTATPVAPTATPVAPTATPVGCGNIPFSLWTLIGDAQVDPDPDWVRLTSTANNQAGGALSPTAFDPSAGFTARFSYADYGGTGADGICVAFFDGATASPALGPSGGALGYSADGGQPGLTNAYLGVGLDEYGNFSNPTDNPDGPGQQPQYFVLRGSGNGTSGYSYLTGVPAASFGGATIDEVARATPRQVEISLIGGIVTLRVDFGSGFQTVLTYNIAAAPGQAALPATLRVAISASTGGSTNAHEIGDFELICS